MSLLNKALLISFVFMSFLRADEFNSTLSADSILNSTDTIYDVTVEPNTESDIVLKIKVIVDKALKEIEKIYTYKPRAIRTSQCQFDKYNTEYCPLDLAPCGEKWDYKDGYSVKRIKTINEIYDKIRVWVGKIGDNYLHGWCKIFHYTTYFYIKDINKVKSFELRRLKFDDYIQVKVNGKSIIVAPYGGYKLEIKKITSVWWGDFEYVDYGTGTGNCELSTSWDKYYHINVKPYLKNGINRVDIYIEVSGGGEGYAYFEGVTSKNNIVCSNGYCKIDDIGDVTISTSYIYYEYLCSGKNEYDQSYYPIVKSGDSPTPPPNNCRALSFVCLSSPDRKCSYVNNQWQCSPFECNSDNMCGFAFCADEEANTDNTNWVDRAIYFQNFKFNDNKECKDKICDLTHEYISSCGKAICPKGFGVFEKDGKCYKYVCPQGSLQDYDGSCYELKCPDGYVSIGDDKCQKQ